MNTQTAPKKIHRPVLLGKVISEVEKIIHGRGIIIDCTMGDGGHSYELYTQFVKGHSHRYLISMDWDRNSIDFVRAHFEETPEELGTKSVNIEKQWFYVQDNFSHIREAVETFRKTVKQEELPIQCILFDLGISSRQLAQKDRGFSFNGKGKLDMRMDPEHYAVTAYQLLNVLSIGKLTDLFMKTVGIKKATARLLAQEVARLREVQPFGSDSDVDRINRITSKIVPVRTSAIGRLHPSTLVFLALRIAVNTELMNLDEVLPKARNLMDEKGRLFVMTYHSSEEKIVTNFIKRVQTTEKVYLPSKREVSGNPRARSAKLFVIS